MINTDVCDIIPLYYVHALGHVDLCSLIISSLQALGLHVHDHQGHDHDNHDHGAFSSEMEYVWKSTAAMATVYLFFLFEVIVGFIAVSELQRF